MKEFFTNKKNVLIISIICMALWGSAFPTIKVGYELLNIETHDIFSKVYFAGLRFFLAGLLVFLAHRLIYKKRVDLKKTDLKYIATLGLIQTTVQYFFFYIGVANTTGIKSSILQSGSTFFTVIFAHFLYKEDRLDLKRILSLILGFSGVVVVNLGKDFDLNFTLIGEGFLLISAILSTLATIYAKKISSKNISPFASSGGQMLIGSIILLIVGKIGMKGQVLDFNLKSSLLLIYSSFISTTAFTLWYMLLQYNSPGEISMYRLFIPIFGAILSVLTLPGESFSLNIFLGLALVVLGIFVLNFKDKKIRVGD